MAMRCLVVACMVLFAVSLASCRPKWHELSSSYSYAQYLKDFRKATPPHEYAEREAAFNSNLRTILKHNAASPPYSWRMGVNHMTDWTPSEIRGMLGYDNALGRKQVLNRIKNHQIEEITGNLNTPHEVDWRGKGVLSAVKDQGKCGSCWSFAAAESIESHYAIQTGELSIVSEQHILSCAANSDDCGGTGGCEGGTAELAFTEIGTIASQWTYPYLSWHGQDDSACRYDMSRSGFAVNVTGFKSLPSNQIEPLKSALANIGPIAVNVDASDWHLYESGIFSGCDLREGIDINHVVQLVGYGTDHTLGLDYWTIRNSWTPEYGELGYIRLLRTDTLECGYDYKPLDGVGCDNGPPNVTVCGTCGVLYDLSYPTVRV